MSSTVPSNTAVHDGTTGQPNDPKVAEQNPGTENVDEQMDEDTRHMIEALDRKRRRLDEEIARFKAAKEEEYRQYEIQLRRLFGKDPDYQAAELRRHSDDAGLRQNSDEPVLEEIEGIPEKASTADDTRPQVERLDSLDSLDEELLREDDAGAGSSSHVEHIRSPHEREREFRGVFTPSYLPLLETKKADQTLTSGETVSTSQPSTTEEKPTREDVQETASTETVTDTTAAAQLPESPPSPLTASKTAVSAPRPILFRRSSLKDPSKKNTSPKRVLFILDDRLIAPSASLEEGSPITPPSYESISYDDSPSEFEASLMTYESPSSPTDIDLRGDSLSNEAAAHFAHENDNTGRRGSNLGVQLAAASPNTDTNLSSGYGTPKANASNSSNDDLDISNLSLDQNSSHQDEDDHDVLFELDEEIDPALSYNARPSSSSRYQDLDHQNVLSNIENQPAHDLASSSYTSSSGFGGYNMPGASAPTGVNPLTINPRTRTSLMSGTRKSSLPISYDYLLGMAGNQGHSAPAKPVVDYSQSSFRYKSARPYSVHGAADQDASHSRYSMGGRLATFKEEEENRYKEPDLNKFGTPNSISGSLRIPAPKPVPKDKDIAGSPSNNDQTPRSYSNSHRASNAKSSRPLSAGSNDFSSLSSSSRQRSDFTRSSMSCQGDTMSKTAGHVPFFVGSRDGTSGYDPSDTRTMGLSSSYFRNAPVGSFQERFNREEQDRRQRELAGRHRTREDVDDDPFGNDEDVGGVEEIEDMEGL